MKHSTTFHILTERELGQDGTLPTIAGLATRAQHPVNGRGPDMEKVNLHVSGDFRRSMFLNT